MSLSKIPLHQKNPFLILKTKSRKVHSRPPFKLFAEGLSSELGPCYQTLSVRIGNQRMILDIVQGNWMAEEKDETTNDSSNMVVMQKRKRALENDNDILRNKLDILREMLAEVTAEKSLQRISNR